MAAAYTMDVFTAILLYAAAAHHYVLSSSVPETTESYICTGKPQSLMSERARADTNCEHIWTVETKPIGSFLNGSEQCHSPCSQVAPGRIVVTTCVNVTLTVLCSEEYLTEYRIHFHGTMINPSPLKNPKDRAYYGAFACLAVFLPMALGLMFQCYKSHWTRNAELQV